MYFWKVGMNRRGIIYKYQQIFVYNIFLTKIKMHAGLIFHCGISDGVGDGVGVILDLKCDSENFIRYRVRFKRCLKDIFPVNKHRMQELLVNNHWVNGRQFEFTTNNKNVLCFMVGMYKTFTALVVLEIDKIVLWKCQ